LGVWRNCGRFGDCLKLLETGRQGKNKERLYWEGYLGKIMDFGFRVYMLRYPLTLLPFFGFGKVFLVENGVWGFGFRDLYIQVQWSREI
jgi:hypothetical protein